MSREKESIYIFHYHWLCFDRKDRHSAHIYIYLYIYVYIAHTVCVFLDFSLRILFSLLPQRRIPRTNTQMATDYVNIYQYLDMYKKKLLFTQLLTVYRFYAFLYRFFSLLPVVVVVVVVALASFFECASVNVDHETKKIFSM